ncbi:hypothetical protein PNH50_18980 (plasmid) [Leisingera aquaemixtae]|uniref:hypothetical protein n=1 Tax=Leisingera aquaemixtae TaxID=1396826 RepID=UPI0039844A0F
MSMFLVFSAARGNADGKEVLICGVVPITGSSYLPSELSIQLLTGQRLAAVGSRLVMGAYGQPVLADLQKKGAGSYVLRWEVEPPGSLGGPVPATVQYRAVLNMQNHKITVLAADTGGYPGLQRAAGTCTAAGR